jgi:hypothetical protein
VAESVCEPIAVDKNVNVAEPFERVSGVCAAPSTAIVTEPLGVAVLEVAPGATVTVIRSLAPGAGVGVDADSIVFDGWFPVTVIVTEPVEATNLESPE